MRRTIIAFATLTAACAVARMDPPQNTGGSDPDAAQQADASMPETGDPRHGTFCGQPGRSCASSSDCCSGECVAATVNGVASSVCYDPPRMCAANGQSCALNDDCCSLLCTDGTCARGCAELWTDCSNATCCSGSCNNNVCQLVGPLCSAIGATCTSGSSCCSGVCTNGACDKKVCAERGDACKAASDCCSGACSNNVCVDKPQCAWGGPCTSNFQCCTGTCKMNGIHGQCEPPVGNTVCQFLERGHNTDFADCFNCIGTACCNQEYTSLDWTQCFQDCMSTFETWDSWPACVTSCAKKAPAPDALISCVQSSCSTACKVQP